MQAKGPLIYLGCVEVGTGSTVVVQEVGWLAKSPKAEGRRSGWVGEYLHDDGWGAVGLTAGGDSNRWAFVYFG